MKYKLVKVAHWRCDEHDGMEYFIIPVHGDSIYPEKSEDDVDKDIDEVCRAMIDLAKQQYEELPKVNHFFNIKDYDENLTIKEAKEQFKKQTDAYNLVLDQQQKRERTFSRWLEDKGYSSLYFLKHGDEIIDVYCVTAQWGHNHGLDLNYERYVMPD